MGKSIPRASCSKALTRQASSPTAYAALRPWDGFSHPYQEHMKDTYIPRQDMKNRGSRDSATSSPHKTFYPELKYQMKGITMVLTKRQKTVYHYQDTYTYSQGIMF